MIAPDDESPMTLTHSVLNAPVGPALGRRGSTREQRDVFRRPARLPRAAVQGIQALLVVGKRRIVRRRVGRVRSSQGVVQLVWVPAQVVVLLVAVPWSHLVAGGDPAAPPPPLSPTVPP